MESSPLLEEEGLAGRIHITLSSGTVSKDVRSEDLHLKSSGTNLVPYSTTSP